jgi:hypothetical protein
MSNIELVMEVGSCLSEVSLNFLVQREGSLDHMGNLFLNRSLELAEVLVEISRVNG